LKSLVSAVAEILQGTPKCLEELPWLKVTLSFSFGCDFMMGLGKPKLCTKLEVASFSRCRNIRGNPKFWGAPLAQRHTHFSFGWAFIIGLGKPQLHAKFELQPLQKY